MHDRLRKKQIEELQQAVNSGRVENPGALAITEADSIAQKMRHYDAKISTLKVSRHGCMAKFACSAQTIITYR